MRMPDCSIPAYHIAPSTGRRFCNWILNNFLIVEPKKISNQGQCYTAPMYARKLRVNVILGDERKPCPLDWLDAFCMRNFTGSAEFDDTLPTGDGQLEASLRVNPERLAAAFAEWLTKRGKGNGQAVRVEIHET